MTQQTLPLPLVAEDFKQWRMKLNWTPAKAARWLGVPLPTYRNWEQDHRHPHRPEYLRKRMKEAKPSTQELP